jgi:hypothetical protein
LHIITISVIPTLDYYSIIWKSLVSVRPVWIFVYFVVDFPSKTNNPGILRGRTKLHPFHHLKWLLRQKDVSQEAHPSINPKVKSPEDLTTSITLGLKAPLYQYFLHNPAEEKPSVSCLHVNKT